MYPDDDAVELTSTNANSNGPSMATPVPNHTSALSCDVAEHNNMIQKVWSVALWQMLQPDASAN